MKMIKLSEKLLKYMVTEYKKQDTYMFSFEKFKTLYPNETDDFISKALYHLEDNCLVSVYSAGDVAYMTTLLPEGITDCEENTLLKKGYTAIKEIKALLP